MLGASKNVLIYCLLVIILLVSGHCSNGCYQHDSNQPPSPTITVTLDVTKVSKTINENFLSVGLGTRLLNSSDWSGFDVNNKRLQRMVKELSPGYLRLGGTSADEAYFEEKPLKRCCNTTTKPPIMTNKIVPKLSLGQVNISFDTYDLWTEELSEPGPYRPFKVTGADWMKLNEFCILTNMSLLFDFNAFLRKTESAPLDLSNARQLLKFSSSLGYKGLSFELGNEPNSYRHKWGISIQPKRLGKDFYRLRKLIRSIQIYQNSTVVGPDVNNIRRCPDRLFGTAGDGTISAEYHAKECSALRYLDGFLPASLGSVDALTLHDYYLNGRTAKAKHFLNPKVLDRLASELDLFNNRYPGKKFWLGETGSAFGGGAKGLSDRFIAGFLWLDKLGLGAVLGLDVVIRQSLFHGHYALIDKHLKPSPDYWLSVLYKRLVSNKVLAVQSNGPKTLRLYAHCFKNGSSSQEAVIFGQNMSSRSLRFTVVANQSSSSQYISHEILQYELTAPNQDLLSKMVILNGDFVRYEVAEQFPSLEPKPVSNFHMEPYSFSFWTFHLPMNFSICQ